MKDSKTNRDSGNIVIEPKPAKAIITPYAMAKMSEDLHMSSKNYKPDRFPLVNYFLYCASIELALKAAILSSDFHESQLVELKNISHNLHQLINRYESVVQNDFLLNDEKQVLIKMNKYYKDKGLEYFTNVVMEQSLQAFKNFPDLNTLEKVSIKLNAYIVSNQYFINADTPQRL